MSNLVALLSLVSAITGAASLLVAIVAIFHDGGRTPQRRPPVRKGAGGSGAAKQVELAI